MSKLPTPGETGVCVDENLLESARLRLASALKRNGRNRFTYDASLFPHGTADILLGELAAAGWRHKYNSDWRDGDFYEIWPA